MRLRYWLCISILIAISVRSSSQSLIEIRDLDGTLDDFEVKQLIDSTFEIFDDFDLSSIIATIINTEDDCYLLADGFNYVFQWNGESFSNMYKGRFHGYNFDSYKFSLNNVIYSFGGYGFWSSHTKLTFFDTENMEWDIIPPNNDSSPFQDWARSTVFFYDNTIFIHVPYVYELVSGRNIKKVEEYDFYKFDLDENVWLRMGTFELDERNGRSFESQNYLMFYKNGYAHIIDKEQLEYKSGVYIDPTLFPNIGLNKTKQPIIYRVFGDSLSLYYLENFKKYTINVASLYTSSANPSMSIYKTKKWPILELLILLGVILLSFWYWKRKKDKVKNTAFPYPLLLKFKGQIIDQKSLDKCLNIDSIISDNISRNRRSKILQNIADNYSGVISINRIRDEEDRRLFKYRID